jgi:hypothetical protein
MNAAGAQFGRTIAKRGVESDIRTPEKATTPGAPTTIVSNIHTLKKAGVLHLDGGASMR